LYGVFSLTLLGCLLLLVYAVIFCIKTNLLNYKEEQMHYWPAGLCCLFLLAGCGGSGSSTDDSAGFAQADEVEDSNSSSNETVSASSTDEGEVVDGTLITCSDHLEDVVLLINQYRAQSQVCGDTRYPAVDGLVWNELLSEAAEEHSSNMANYDFFDHTGLDGSSVGTRVTAQGYDWSYVAENIAAGQVNAETALADLMASEGHCKNLMSANVSEVGLACVVNGSSTYQRYWTQVFATGRD